MSVHPTLSAQHEFGGPRPSRLAAGIALSLAVHLALLFAWRQGTHVKPEAGIAPSRSIAVWLRPAPPVAPPKAEPAPPTKSAARPARTASPKHRIPPDVIALPPHAPAVAPPPDSFTVEPPQPAAPHFDIDAARKLARQLANEPDPAKAGTPVAQLAKKQLETETKAARAIAGAKRRDCKDGIPGGLLAPLILLMDKKDSGCKW